MIEEAIRIKGEDPMEEEVHKVEEGVRWEMLQVQPIWTQELGMF